ncbi:hypothetical protein CDL15_Pgr014843 [Punica granatum]|uniref:Retroviral polymerase SH3-like domain-containing protein n=1 Tax=Punica granatum TaxID=22663 RepID=A0A218Y0G9_PUNGR|nr:hypothetical protein CDL15_Pgr014843 [Punica granatum]
MCIYRTRKENKGYRCLDANKNHVYVSRHVCFNESDFPFAHPNVIMNLDQHVVCPNIFPVSIPQVPVRSNATRLAQDLNFRPQPINTACPHPANPSPPSNKAQSDSLGPSNSVACPPASLGNLFGPY